LINASQLPTWFIGIALHFSVSEISTDPKPKNTSLLTEHKSFELSGPGGHIVTGRRRPASVTTLANNICTFQYMHDVRWSSWSGIALSVLIIAIGRIDNLHLLAVIDRRRWLCGLRPTIAVDYLFRLRCLGGVSASWGIRIISPRLACMISGNDVTWLLSDRIAK